MNIKTITNISKIETQNRKRTLNEEITEQFVNHVENFTNEELKAFLNSRNIVTTITNRSTLINKAVVALCSEKVLSEPRLFELLKERY